MDAERDWNRLFPDADHRWTMGLRRGDAATFFASREGSGRVLAERAWWLDEDPDTYAALLPAGEAAVRDTAALARSWGWTVDPTRPATEQLQALGTAGECDLLWLLPDETGLLRLVGGVVCFPSGWALRDKLGDTMDEIHAPVPGLNAALDRSIATALGKLSRGVAWLRENVGYSRSSELNQHPSRPRRRLDETVTADDVWLRIEHQLLLRLAPSEGVLFAIRVEVVPLTELIPQSEPARRAARLLRTMPPSAAAYKGIDRARLRIAALLES
jgi:hypothetical protein